MSSLSYRFRDERLLELALTHASTHASEDNERLEFLGDAVLDLVIAHALYEQSPSLNEGTMTERKSWVVSRETLARMAGELGLGDLARFGHGMHSREIPRSVLANLYEAYVGAIYLDGGLEPSRTFILESLAGPLVEIAREGESKNPKQELQQIAQLETGHPPRYVLIEDRGRAHARAFRVAAQIGEVRFPAAWGRTRKEAERWAAFEALLVIEEDRETADERA